MFLNIFAPWCGHCKNFAPEFRKIARKVYESGYAGKIRVATIDGTANESPDERIQWDAFPTIVLIRKGVDNEDDILRYEVGPLVRRGLGRSTLPLCSSSHDVPLNHCADHWKNHDVVSYFCSSRHENHLRSPICLPPGPARRVHGVQVVELQVEFCGRD